MGTHPLVVRQLHACPLLLQYAVAPTELVPTDLPVVPEPAKSEQGRHQPVPGCLASQLHDNRGPKLHGVLAAVAMTRTATATWCCAASVRLVNSANPANKTAGRLEVQHNGVWGTVCDDGFSSAAATVVCRQVGAGVGMHVHTSRFGLALPCTAGPPGLLDALAALAVT